MKDLNVVWNGIVKDWVILSGLFKSYYLPFEVEIADKLQFDLYFIDNVSYYS
jgi:hypothetical protein